MNVGDIYLQDNIVHRVMTVSSHFGTCKVARSDNTFVEIPESSDRKPENPIVPLWNVHKDWVTVNLKRKKSSIVSLSLVSKKAISLQEWLDWLPLTPFQYSKSVLVDLRGKAKVGDILKVTFSDGFVEQVKVTKVILDKILST